MYAEEIKEEPYWKSKCGKDSCKIMEVIEIGLAASDINPAEVNVYILVEKLSGMEKYLYDKAMDGVPFMLEGFLKAFEPNTQS
mgnify:FL=1